MALSQPLNDGSVLRFDSFAGQNRYVMELRVAGRGRIQVPAGTFDAIRVIPRYVYVSDQSVPQMAREATIWVSADSRRLPVRIEAAAYIGRLYADLVSVTPAK